MIPSSSCFFFCYLFKVLFVFFFHVLLPPSLLIFILCLFIIFNFGICCLFFLFAGKINHLSWIKLIEPVHSFLYDINQLFLCVIKKLLFQQANAMLACYVSMELFNKPHHLRYLFAFFLAEAGVQYAGTKMPKTRNAVVFKIVKKL